VVRDEGRGALTEPAAGPAIFTVGHGTRSTEEFVRILRSAGIERLVDVRTAPGSRKHPQFGRAELAATLEAAGVEYVWRKDLGGWRKPRPDSPHRALRSPGFRGYADHMETDQFDQAVRWLIETSTRSPTAVMCAESMWWRCHRRMIADALTARGCAVTHLLSEDRRQPHRLHPAARLDGTRVVYDQEAADQQRVD
jgi:uncharacterized protein (DUF488 family)